MYTHISNNLPKELQKVLPDAIGRSLQQPQLVKLMAETLATSVSFRVEEHFANTLQNVVVPAFSQLATTTAQRVAADIQREAEEQIGNLERQTHADSLKIDQLVSLVTGLSETVSAMAGAQEEFQAHLLRLQQQLGDRADKSRQTSSGTSQALATAPEKTPQQLQYEKVTGEITSDLAAGEFQDAILRWLRSGLHQEVFEGLISKYSPNFIRDLAPIYLVAVGSVVSERLEGEALMQRLAWLDTILQCLKARATAGEIVSVLFPLIDTDVANFCVGR